LRKGNTLKVDIVGENTKRRRLIVVALFIPKLVNTKSGERLILWNGTGRVLTLRQWGNIWEIKI
jgi:hypothetical protein